MLSGNLRKLSQYGLRVFRTSSALPTTPRPVTASTLDRQTKQEKIVWRRQNYYKINLTYPEFLNNLISYGAL